MTTDPKEAAIQRLADAYAAEWPTDKPMMGHAPMVWLRKLARIAIEQGVVPLWALASEVHCPGCECDGPWDGDIPWDAVCAEVKP